MAMFPINLSITRIAKHTPTTWSFFMIPQNTPRPGFVAGQVAVLEMDHYGDSYYAFASAPEESEFEFLIKRRPSASVTGALFDPHIAKRIVLKEIVGTGFPVEQHKGHDLVFVAMGTGLAPLRSALRHIFYQRGEYGRLFVLYGARQIEDFCFEDEMITEWKRQGVELRQVISQPGDAAWDGPTGYVQSLLDHVVPEMNNPLALVCGSREMIEQTRGRLAELGFSPEKILTNY
jgi:NAD(P)H-flavin reductase